MSIQRSVLRLRDTNAPCDDKSPISEKDVESVEVKSKSVSISQLRSNAFKKEETPKKQVSLVIRKPHNSTSREYITDFDRLSANSIIPPSKETKFKIFEDRVKNFQKNDDHCSDIKSNIKKRKIRHISSFKKIGNHSDPDRQAHPVMQNFQFELDPSITDSSSLLYQCQIPLFKLNNWYNINQFSIAGNRSEIEGLLSNSFRVVSVEKFSELASLTTVTSIDTLKEKYVVLINYKQSLSNSIKFHDLDSGDLIQLKNPVAIGKGLEMYHDWKLIPRKNDLRFI